MHLSFNSQLSHRPANHTTRFAAAATQPPVVKDQHDIHIALGQSGKAFVDGRIDEGYKILSELFEPIIAAGQPLPVNDIPKLVNAFAIYFENVISKTFDQDALSKLVTKLQSVKFSPTHQDIHRPQLRSIKPWGTETPVIIDDLLKSIDRRGVFLYHGQWKSVSSLYNPQVVYRDQERVNIREARRSNFDDDAAFEQGNHPLPKARRGSFSEELTQQNGLKVEYPAY